MFLHLGGDTVIPQREVIAIIDASASKWPVTEEFIDIAKDEGFVKDVTRKGKTKSFVITTHDIYISSISCTTLKKRAGQSLAELEKSDL